MATRHVLAMAVCLGAALICGSAGTFRALAQADSAEAAPLPNGNEPTTAATDEQANKEGRSGASGRFITNVGQYNLHDGKLVIRVWEEDRKIRWSATQPAKVTKNGTIGPETVRPNDGMSKESPWFVFSSSSKEIWNIMNVLTFGETGSFWKEVDLVPAWPILFQPDATVPKEVLDRLPPDRRSLGNAKVEGKGSTGAADEQKGGKARPKETVGLTVRINATDATSKRPVKSLALIPSGYEESVRQPTWQSQYLKRFVDTPAEFRTERPWDATVLRIEADGYIPFLTRPIRRDEGELTLEVALTPDPGLAGKVLTPSGAPADGAVLALCTYTNEVNVHGGKLSYLGHGQQLGSLVTAAADGAFRLKSEVDPWVLVVAHDSGYAEVTAPEFAQSSSVQLHPWGRIESECVVNGKPIIGLSLHIGAGRYGDVNLYYGEEVSTDAAGRFVVDRVPPVTLHVQPILKHGESTGTFLQSICRTAIVAGQTTRITLPRAGRAVIGRISLPADSKLRLADLVIEGKMSLAPWSMSMLLHEDDEGQRAAYGEFAKSELGQAFHRDGIAVSGDGTFRVEGLPETQYLLYLTAYRKPARPGGERGPWISSNTMRVVDVPPLADSEEPVDLGNLVLDAAEETPLQPPADSTLDLVETSESEKTRTPSGLPSEEAAVPPGGFEIQPIQPGVAEFDRMPWSRCFAGSQPENAKAHGGKNYGSGNLPRTIDPRLPRRENALYLHLDVKKESGQVGSNLYPVYKLFLVNTSGQDCRFSNFASRLNLIQEAQDNAGHWRPIEHVPAERDIQSVRYEVVLPSARMWMFTVPKYEGSLKTKLRFKLTRENQPPIYSEQFDGSVNPGQFKPAKQPSRQTGDPAVATTAVRVEGTPRADSKGPVGQGRLALEAVTPTPTEAAKDAGIEVPGSVAKLVSWPTAQQRAGKVVQPDSSQGALRAKRESIGWIRKIVDPQWLPDNPEESLGSKLVLLEKAYSEVDTSHVEWEKEGYRFRVSQTSTVFYLDVTPTRGKSAVGDVAAQRKAFRELASKVIQDVTDARSADGTRVAVGGTKPILMRVSFETARMRESTHGIVAQPAALDVKDTLDRRCWDFWWRRMGWCTDGQTLGLFTLKTEGGAWKANYDATGLDRGWFSPPAALLPKPAKGEESKKADSPLAVRPEESESPSGPFEIEWLKDLDVLAIRGQVTAFLTDGKNPAWSPDGKWIAFTREVGSDGNSTEEEV